MAPHKKYNSSGQIEEICVIRLLLIVLLVLYHSFAPYCGSWRPIGYEPEIFSLYWWIGKASYSFMLECFTFISGWVYGFQVYTKGKQLLRLKSIVTSKLRRLIVPSIVFSLIYLLILKPYSFSHPVDCITSILSGVGHMWYLPMLFWCFIGIWIIDRNNIRPRVALLLVLVMSVFPIIPFPFGLQSTMVYMIFFYAGYIFGRKIISIDGFINLRSIVLIGLVFIVIFVIGQGIIVPYYIELVSNQMINSKIVVSMWYLGQRIVILLYSSLGVLITILLSQYIIHKRGFNLPIFWINFSTYTFGIYIFQQFILQWTYYHTDFVDCFPSYIIPWLAFVMTLLLSWFLAMILRRSRIGRLLI